MPDRLLRVYYESKNDRSFYSLYLCDQQPVVLGARYRYSLVRFNDRREPAEIIPAGEAELPLQPDGEP
jgi:hypothetical protein